MKTNRFFRAMSLVILGTMTAVALHAQNVATPSAGAANVESGTSDYVTIGSRVPYYVQTDPVIQAMTDAGTMKQSIFRWFVTTAADVTIPGIGILKYDGTAATQYDAFRNVQAGTGYYDNEISIVWSTGQGFAAGTQYKVKVAEKSVTLSSTIQGCEDATPEELNVFVLARPTVAFDGTEGGGCGINPGTDFYVPLTVTGLGNWEVTYTVSYNGGAAGAPQTYTLNLAAPAVTDATVIAESTTPRTAAGTPTSGTDGLRVSLPAGQYGYYDVTITNITDRISRKSQDALAAQGAAGSYRIYVVPTPTTSPIQHLKNL